MLTNTCFLLNSILQMMRYLLLLLAVTMAWLASVGAAVAENSSALVKTREGSLVLEDSGAKTPGVAKKDTLHTMLSQEVQVYIYRGKTLAWPHTQTLGQTQFYRPGGPCQKLAGPYLEKIIHKYAARYGVDPSLVRAVMRHESGFNPHAVSPKGAQGLMQLMPGTAALMGVENPFDPEQNVAGGVGYLRFCLDSFGHSVPLAVAAYNAGPARVAKARGVPSIPETQNFVKNVMGSYTGVPPSSVPTVKTEDKPPVKPSAKLTTPQHLRHKILPTSQRTVSPEDYGEKVSHRPRAKVIVVHYPKTKQVAAKPQGAD